MRPFASVAAWPLAQNRPLIPLVAGEIVAPRPCALSGPSGQPLPVRLRGLLTKVETADVIGGAPLIPMSDFLPAKPIDAGVRIGHVHLKVADLDRALGFYRDVLGFELTQRYGKSAVFLSAGGYHHHIGLNTWESAGGHPPGRGTTGLFHLAILYPSRGLLADALRRLLEAGIALDGASDHGVSEALYLRDPDQNGVELYWDRPQAEWPVNVDGELEMFTRPLDLHDLLAAKDGI